MQQRIDLELVAFLRDYPKMSISPSRNSSLVLRGMFDFTWQPKNKNKITDFYSIEIHVPPSFPNDVPTVVETGRKILRDGNHHVNNDNSLCLGSPLRLRLILSQNPSLMGFAEVLVQYLYSISHKLQFGKFPFGELAHGEEGVIQDYINLFRLHSAEQVKQTLKLLVMKKRLANKKPCPCGCGKRLGVCRLHFQVNKFRKIAPKHWLKNHVLNPGAGM